MTERRYECFADLPEWFHVMTRYIGLWESRDPDAWIRESLPALGGASILDLMNRGPGGRRRLLRGLQELVWKCVPSDAAEKMDQELAALEGDDAPPTAG